MTGGQSGGTPSGGTPSGATPSGGTATSGRCARCGALNPLTYSHCTTCGVRLPWQDGAPAETVSLPPPQRHSTVRIWPRWALPEQKIRTAFTDLEAFLPTQAFVSVDNRTGLAVDETARKLCLAAVDKTLVHRRIFDYKDVLGSEIVEDGYILATTSGPSTVMGGLRGGLPSVLPSSGGLVETVALKLVIDDIRPLIHIVKFLNHRQERGSDAHRAALFRAHHWHSLMVAVISLNGLVKPR